MGGDRCDLLCLDLPRAERLRQTRIELLLAEQAALAAERRSATRPA